MTEIDKINKKINDYKSQASALEKKIQELQKPVSEIKSQLMAVNDNIIEAMEERIRILYGPERLEAGNDFLLWT